MLCIDESGKKYIIQFCYKNFRRRGKRIKTTCSIRPMGTDFEEAISGTVTLDSRDTHIKSQARKKALAKALNYTLFNRLRRTAIWNSYFEQSTK